MRRLTVLIASLLCVGLLVSCGDDDGGGAAPPADESSESAGNTTPPAAIENDEPNESTSGSGAAGSVTVDGTTYALDEVNRCDPSDLDIAGLERELEVQFFGRSTDGERVQIDLYHERFCCIPAHDVSGAGPEGIFGTSLIEQGGGWVDDAENQYPDPPVSFDGTRATGSLVLVDALTFEETIDIDFDVTVPEDLNVCR